MPLCAIGARVTHSQYGDGTVSSVNEYHTKIDFDSHGLRTFASAMVSLTPSDTAAPVKSPARRKRATRAPVAAAR
jgi:hypothetical protein